MFLRSLRVGSLKQCVVQPFCVNIANPLEVFKGGVPKAMYCAAFVRKTNGFPKSFEKLCTKSNVQSSFLAHK